eukprot:1156962-Pelagomonas_calceolata.AAC.8
MCSIRLLPQAQRAANGLGLLASSLRALAWRAGQPAVSLTSTKRQEGQAVQAGGSTGAAAAAGLHHMHASKPGLTCAVKHCETVLAWRAGQSAVSLTSTERQERQAVFDRLYRQAAALEQRRQQRLEEEREEQQRHMFRARSPGTERIAVRGG